MSLREFTEKRGRISDLMATHGLGGLLLSRSSSFSWATCGRSANVATNAETAFASLLFTPRRNYLIADRVEMPRLLAEEFGDLPFEPLEYPWYVPTRKDALVASLAEGPLGADVPREGARTMTEALAALRYDLTREEQERFRSLGRVTGEAIEAAARAVEPGQTEHMLAARLVFETWSRGAEPVVVLVAADDRIRRFRHPPPTATPVRRAAMLVLCARRAGLVASATRLVHIGPLPDDLRRRADATARIDATAHAATWPGNALAGVFEAILEAYNETGYGHEWRDHHQGGLAGYENRESVANPRVSGTVRLGQAYAWNPSVAGVKSEDTLLVREPVAEVLTATGAWPTLEVQVEGESHYRPDILVL